MSRFVLPKIFSSCRTMYCRRRCERYWSSLLAWRAQEAEIEHFVRTLVELVKHAECPLAANSLVRCYIFGQLKYSTHFGDLPQ